MEHTRIDEGVKRPNLPAAKWPERKPPTAGKLGPNFDATPALQRYLDGEDLGDIAATYGVHRNALTYHLLKEHIREDWRQAQVAVSLAEKYEAEEVIKGAPDALSLARAREILRSKQWDLERLEARLFGQNINIAVTHDIGADLQRISERMQAKTVVSEQHAAVLPDNSDLSTHADDT